MKKRSEEMQILRAGCSKAESKIFAPPQTPFPGARDGQNLISWRWSLPSPTNPVWWGSMHTILSYHGNRPTHTHTHTQTGPITIHCVAARGVNITYLSSSRGSVVKVQDFHPVNLSSSCAVTRMCHWRY